MYTLCDVPAEAILPDVIGPHREGPVVGVRHHQGVLVKHGQELLGQEVEEAGEQHRLDVGDQLGLADQPVQAGALLKALEGVWVGREGRED